MKGQVTKGTIGAMRIRDLLACGAPSISFEFFPPKSDEAARQLEQTIGDLAPLMPTFVSVTWGAGGSTREKTIDIVTRIRRETGVEAAAHLTCVGATKEEIGGILDRLGEAGVENIVALRGDPPKGEKAFTATEGGFRYANELIGYIRERHARHFSLGGAAYPEKHVECANPAMDLDNLKRKTDAGLDFLITQLFFDNQYYWDFVARARAAGITIPIIPGLMPIANATQVLRFGATLPARLAAELNRRGDNPEAVAQLGVAHAAGQAMELLTHGAPGIHFYTLNRGTATKSIFSALRIMGLV